jgi:hypothetical protein
MFQLDGPLTLKQLMKKERIMHVPNSIGAIAERFYVKCPYSVRAFDYCVKEGSYITDVSIIAEGEKIRDVQRLIREYPLQNGELTTVKD